MEHQDIVWHAPEFEHHEKEVLWAWGSIIISVILLTIAILGQNFLFAIFIVFAEILVLVWGHKEPRNIKFEIDEKNLVINGREKHALKDLDHFGFIELGEDEQDIELGLVFRKLRPIIRILIPLELRKPVEQKLKLHGRKMEMEPTFIDILERIARF